MKTNFWKYFALAAMLSSSSMLDAATYGELRRASDEKKNANNFNEAIDLAKQAIKAADAPRDGKMLTAYAVADIYAYKLNNSKQAAQALIEISNSAPFTPDEIVSLQMRATHLFMNSRPAESETAIKTLEDLLQKKDISDSSRASVLSRLASIQHSTAPDAAEKNIEEALKLNLPLNVRNQVRNEAANMKKQNNKFDYEKSIRYQQMIIDDPENDVNQKCNTMLGMAATYAAGQTPDFVKAGEILDQVKGIPSANADVIAKAAMQKADYLLRVKNPDFAAVCKSYLSVVDNENLNIGLRVQAFDKLFSTMRRMNAPQNEILAAFDKMSKVELKGGALKDFTNSYGNYLVSIRDFEKAANIFRKYAQVENNDAAKNQEKIWLGDLETARGNTDTAVDYFKQAKNYRKAGEALFKAQRPDEANKVLFEGIKNNANVSDMVGVMIYFNNIADLTELLNGELKPILAEKPELSRNLEGKIKPAMESASYEFVAAVAPMVIANANNKAPSQIIYYQITATAMLGKKAEAAKLIDAAVANEKIEEIPFQFRFRIMQAALNGSDKSAREKAVNKVVADFKDKFTNVKDLPTEMNKAAMAMVMLNNRDAAEAIELSRESLYTPMPNKSVSVPFVKSLPDNVDSWMTSDLIKKRQGALKLDRQLWGANVEFMLATDVAVKRDVAGGKNAQGIDTDLYFYCDENAFYVFVVAFDDNAAKFKDGFASGGSYEIYMATGELQPYYCTLINITDGKADSFYSNYRNEFSRAPRVNEGLSAETKLVAPNATATLLTYPWEMFYNVLPDGKDGKWQFDIMRWSGPGSSWNGTKSVHNRSTYGDVVFNFTPEQLTAIRRNIVYKARQAYNKHQGSKWRGTGIYDFWSNPVIGDVEFYESKVVPLKNELDAVVKEITPEMDDATVNRIYLENADKLFNLDFEISKLRNEYLEEKSFSDK